MPKYDYFCESNDRVIEVSHAMSASVETWGDLRALAGLPEDNTPADAPVRKIISGGYVVSGGMKDQAPPPACPMQVCCGGGCELD